MSDFIRILNSIKMKRTPTWLTPSQINAQVAIKESLRAPGTINLCGSAGSGKTFLAWSLADELGYFYFSHPSLLKGERLPTSKGLIVDNCRHDRWSHRDLLKVLQLWQIHRAVLITRQPVRDYTRYVELELTLADEGRVCENLLALGCFREPGVPNLWYLVNPYLVNLGDQRPSDQTDDLLLSYAA